MWKPARHTKVTKKLLEEQRKPRSQELVELRNELENISNKREKEEYICDEREI